MTWYKMPMTIYLPKAIKIALLMNRKTAGSHKDSMMWQGKLGIYYPDMNFSSYKKLQTSAPVDFIKNIPNQMDSSLTRSACGSLCFTCHEDTETDFDEMMGPFLLAPCGCRLYFCNEPRRNRDLSVAAQAAGQTTSILDSSNAFQEQLFGGAASVSNNLPMTVPAEATAGTLNNEVPTIGNPLDLDNSLLLQNPPDLNRPPYSNLVPGLNRLTTPAVTNTHPMVFSNATDVRPQDPTPAMYDPLDWSRLFSNTPPLTSNSIFDSGNVGLSYNGYDVPILPLSDRRWICPECGSHMQRYDVCPNHRVLHHRELAQFQGTEGIHITDPARRSVRVPNHHPFYVVLSEFGNGQPDTQPRETHAWRAVTPVDRQGQEEYLDDVNPPPTADAENYTRGEEEEVPAIARSQIPLTSAAVEQARTLATDTSPFIPGSSNQRSPVESREDQRVGAITNIGEDDEDSDTTIGHSRLNNQAGSTGPPCNAWPEGRPNGRPQFRAQDGLHRHSSQPTSTAAQSISSRSCGRCSSSYSSTPTIWSPCQSIDSSTPSPPAPGTSSRSGCSRCGCCMNTGRRIRLRDYNMQRVSRRSARSDNSSVESSAIASTIGSTDLRSSSMDLRWERTADSHRQRYYMPLHQRVDFQFHRPRILFRQPTGYSSVMLGIWRRQREAARRLVLLAPSQTRGHSHSRDTVSPYHQIVPTLWWLLVSSLLTSVVLGGLLFVGRSGSGAGR